MYYTHIKNKYQKIKTQKQPTLILAVLNSTQSDILTIRKACNGSRVDLKGTHPARTPSTGAHKGLPRSL